MADEDLSGDDLKVIRYRILFTKPNLEVSFKEKIELISYTTNGSSLGGLELGQFMDDVARHQVPRPARWKEPGNDYPPVDNFPGGKEAPPDEKDWSFPQSDLRYIEFQYEVIRREPRRGATDDRERDGELRQVQQDIESLAPADSKGTAPQVELARGRILP